MSMTPSTFLPKREDGVPYIAEVQSIPLSPTAYSVIVRDKSIFETSLSPNGGSVSMSSFLTRIFDSAYRASLKYKSEEYNGIPLLNAFVQWQIEEIDGSLDDKSKEIIKSYLISKLSAKYKKTKTENAVRVRLSICRDLYDTLSSDDLYYENKVYSSTLRRFLKAVYEDYALLSDCERERLIFADNIIKINEVIKQNGSRYYSFIYAYSNMYSREKRRIRLIPYRIVSDEYKMYNYLVCLSDEKSAGKEFKADSYRISRLSGLSIAEKLSQKEYSSVTEYERLKEGHVKSVKHLLSDPRFGSDESDISKVYLTEKGVEMFGKILYQRPILKGNEKPKPNAVNEFISPPIQVKYYFNKFGKDGVILSPSDSFEEMRTLYVEGAEAYNREVEM